MRRKAFTLIELLVVIAIIGILATIVLVSLGDMRAKARDIKRIQEIEEIRTALELYYHQYEKWPDDDDDPADEGPSGNPSLLDCSGIWDIGNDAILGLADDFIPDLEDTGLFGRTPRETMQFDSGDSANNCTYRYKVSALPPGGCNPTCPNNTAWLCARLENSQSSFGISDQTDCCSNQALVTNENWYCHVLAPF